MGRMLVCHVLCAISFAVLAFLNYGMHQCNHHFVMAEVLENVAQKVAVYARDAVVTFMKGKCYWFAIFAPHFL